MTQSNYEKFQVKIFDEITDMESQNRQWLAQQFVDMGKSAGIDVIAEVLDRGRSSLDVLKEIQQRQSEER